MSLSRTVLCYSALLFASILGKQCMLQFLCSAYSKNSLCEDESVYWRFNPEHLPHVCWCFSSRQSMMIVGAVLVSPNKQCLRCVLHRCPLFVVHPIVPSHLPVETLTKFGQAVQLPRLSAPLEPLPAGDAGVVLSHLTVFI